MKTIILEGTSTSGKTTLANKLADIFKSNGLKCLIVGENDTIMPILNTEDLDEHLAHLSELLGEVYKKKYDITIFDRLHLTSVARTNSTIQDFEDLEKVLLLYDPLVVFLHIDKLNIPNRIFKTLKHRGLSWAAHVNMIGSKKAIVQHYIETQEKIFQHFKSTKLPKIYYDTTTEEFNEIAREIAERYLLNK